MPGFRYRWDGANNTEIPDAGVVVNEGDEFESPVELNHPHATPLNATSKKAATARTDPEPTPQE